MGVRVKRRGDVIFRLLSTIGNAAVAVSRHPGRNPVNVYRIVRDFRALQDLTDRQIRTMSRYIVGNKYIVVRHRHNVHTIEITEKGKRVLARNAIKLLKPKKRTHDGLWRIVLFDVPNEKKRVRDAFAAILKDFGFERVQKSVFILPYPCEKELEIIFDYLHISEFVDIIVATKITREREFKVLFGLR
jgi:DNA-binding transcriptional regulator PaaX